MCEVLHLYLDHVVSGNTLSTFKQRSASGSLLMTLTVRVVAQAEYASSTASAQLSASDKRKREYKRKLPSTAAGATVVEERVL